MLGRAAMGVILIPALLYFLCGTWWSEDSRQPQASEVRVKGFRVRQGLCQPELLPGALRTICALQPCGPMAACFLLLHVPVVFLSRGWRSVFQAVCDFLSFPVTSHSIMSPVKSHSALVRTEKMFPFEEE